MALTKISSTVIADDAITSDKIAASVSLGVKVSNVAIANSSYTVLDDTAVDVGGGYIVITGAGFVDGATVLIDGTQATAVSFVSTTELRAQVPAKAAATYNIYVVNPDGGTAIRVNGLTYSSTPSWVTTSPLSNQINNISFSLNFDATGATTYANTTALPAGTTLLSNGYFYGTVTGLTQETTYSFTVKASDAENQDADKNFQVTFSIADSNFNSTVLLLQGDGTNGSNNHTFVDSSNNALVLTREGDTYQGSFSPFSPTGWSAYFDGSGDYISFPSSTAANFGTGDFTVEFWVFPQNNDVNLLDFRVAQDAVPWAINLRADNIPAWYYGSEQYGSTALVQNEWSHVAFCREGTTHRIFINGVITHSFTDTTNYGSSSAGRIGASLSNVRYTNGYFSNVRFVKGTAAYTSNFTVPVSPLTAITNTTFLSLQNNRLIDNSTNNYTITRAGDTKVVAFSPFAPSGPYDTTLHGGSAYFDGTGDCVRAGDATTDFVLGSSNWTMECWYYATSSQNTGIIAKRQHQQTSGWTLGIGAMGAIISGTWVDPLVGANDGSNPVNQWTHLVYTRTGNTFRKFVNGVMTHTNDRSGELQNYTASSTCIGRAASSSDEGNFTGYISALNFLIGEVKSEYATSSTTTGTKIFDVPTAPPTPSANSEVTVQFTNAGIYDGTAKNLLTTIGNAQISTSVKKYGTGSLAFDGTGDYLIMRDVPYLNLGSADFTIEFWIYFTSWSDGKVPLTKGYGALSNSPFLFYEDAVANAFKLYMSSNGSAWDIASGRTIISGTPTLNTWYHIAVTRNGSTFRSFVDGTQTDTFTSSSSLYNTTQPVVIGAKTDGSGGFAGYIDDLRITNGVARYTSNFTPSTAAFIAQ